jgi:hypothetical protein
MRRPETGPKCGSSSRSEWRESQESFVSKSRVWKTATRASRARAREATTPTEPASPAGSSKGISDSPSPASVVARTSTLAELTTSTKPGALPAIANIERTKPNQLSPRTDRPLQFLSRRRIGAARHIPFSMNNRTGRRSSGSSTIMHRVRQRSNGSRCRDEARRLTLWENGSGKKRGSAAAGRGAGHLAIQRQPRVARSIGESRSSVLLRKV